MASARLRFGLLGLGAAGQRWCRALRSAPEVSLVAVGDEDRTRAESLADECGAEAYTDLRLLLVEKPLDAVVFALPAFVAESYLPVAADRALPVLAETPPGRDFDSALRAVQLFYAADLPLVIASPWRFDPALLEALAGLGPIQLAQAMATRDPGTPLDWRGDTRRAGGGAMLDVGIEPIDLLTAMMGLPGDLACQCTRLAATAAGRFDTEDTAFAAWRYGDGAAASVSAAWRAGPPRLEATLLGARGFARLTRQTLEIGGENGAWTTVRRPSDNEAVAEMLRSFIATVQSRPSGYPGRAADLLASMAVIDAAYLAARTHALESPMRAYERAGLPTPRGPAPGLAAAL